MKRNELTIQQFISLRRELEGHEARLFWIVSFGLLGLPFLSYFMWDVSARNGFIVPFIVLVLAILFLAQQRQTVHVGRCIRGLIDEHQDMPSGWEAWLESRPRWGLMDRHVSACLIVVFFVYYFLSVGLALHRLWGEAAGDPSGTYWNYFLGAAGVYAISTLWGLAVFLRHGK
jgi:hypothetical protein